MSKLKLEVMALAPARLRVGLPVVPDGSTQRPLLLRLPAVEGVRSSCNNGCRDCVTQPVDAPESAWDVDVRGLHVVIRDREPTLRRDLPTLVAALKARGPASVTLLTNGRLLGYERLSRELLARGIDRFVVKLFGLNADEHDAWTRDAGSYQQALAGISVLRRLGARAFVTFPRPVAPEQRAEEAARRKALAEELTASEYVELPEPQVESHGNEFRFDVIERRGDLSRTYFANSFFPMVHVNTGPACNIRCTYCNVHGGDDQRLYPVDYVEMLVDHAAAYVKRIDAKGRPTLDFIGGEPTLHPHLERLIAKGRALGFEQVTICTNGVQLMRKGFLDGLVNAGLTGIRYSFHDHRPEVANKLADVPNLGTRYVDTAAMLLARKDLQTHLFRILLTENIDALPDYLRWVAAHNTAKRVDVTLGMPSMRGRLFENRGQYPSLASLRPAVEAGVTLAQELGLDISFHHTPGCLLPTHPELHACLHIATTSYEPLVDRRIATNFEGDARYVGGCANCAGREHGCHGLPSHYVQAEPEASEAWVRPHGYAPEAGSFDPAKAPVLGGG